MPWNIFCQCDCRPARKIIKFSSQSSYGHFTVQKNQKSQQKTSGIEQNISWLFTVKYFS